jgi:NTE family protein
MAGLACGLRRDGVDLGEADLIVGTSAGAIVGALLATGQDPGRLATSTRSAAHRPTVDPARTDAVFALLGNRGLDPAEARRHIGRLALQSSSPEADAALMAGRAALIGADTWPRRRLLVTAVDATSGEPVVWDRDSGVPLVAAVAASSAFPGAAPPVAVDGRRYMDGALRSGSNADLAAGARTLVVVEPLAHQFPREQLTEQLAEVGGGHRGDHRPRSGLGAGFRLGPRRSGSLGTGLPGRSSPGRRGRGATALHLADSGHRGLTLTSREGDRPGQIRTGGIGQVRRHATPVSPRR